MILALSPKYLCVHASFVCRNIEKKLCFSFFEGENSLFLMVNIFILSANILIVSADAIRKSSDSLIVFPNSLILSLFLQAFFVPTVLAIRFLCDSRWRKVRICFTKSVFSAAPLDML